MAQMFTHRSGTDDDKFSDSGDLPYINIKPATKPLANSSASVVGTDTATAMERRRSEEKGRNGERGRSRGDNRH